MASPAFTGFLTRPLLVFWLECLAIPVAYVFAVNITIPGPLGWKLIDHALYAFIMLAAWLRAATEQDILSPRRSGLFGAFLLGLIRAAGQALVLSVFMMVLLAPRGVDSDFLAVFLVGSILIMAATRGALTLIYRLRRHAGYDARHILFVGANSRTTEFADSLSKTTGYFIEGFLDDDPERSRTVENATLKHLGSCADFDRVLIERHIEEVYVTLPLGSFYDTIQHIIQRCEQLGLDAHVKADFFQLRHARNLPMYVGSIPVLSLTSVPEDHFALALKRALDFIVASILLLILSPVFLVIAIIIKVQSPGPVFFLQERVGQNQRRFKMVKFRSMVANAESLRKQLEEKNEADGPVFKIRQDPRITPFGRFIRVHSIDELPQLINVWRGEMSLVGPRPPIPSEVDQYMWQQRRRLSVKPGMTGLWQVSGRSDVAFKQWVEMDLAYIDSWTFLMDIGILFKTFRIVIEGKGAA